MSWKGLLLVHVAAFHAATSALQFTNITDAMLLNSYFLPANASWSDNSSLSFYTALMTHYVEPTQQEMYVWLGTFATMINRSDIDSEVLINSWTKSGIFDSSFTPYSGSNDIRNLLPLTVSQHESTVTPGRRLEYDEVVAPVMCTSPTTNDIFTCWTKLSIDYNAVGPLSRTMYNIQCNIFFVKNNTFSPVINVSNATFNESILPRNVLNIGVNPLCFHDAYFVPYTNLEGTLFATERIYGALIDLNGRVRHNRMDFNLSVSFFAPNVVYTVQGSKQFTQHIGHNANASFMFVHSVYELATNGTNITASFAYYTNINDANIPVTVYQTAFIDNQDDRQLVNSYILPSRRPIMASVNDHCCYITIYADNAYDQTTGDWYDDVYAVITDIYGTHINVNNGKDILVVHAANSVGDVTETIYNLPMISSNETSYMMITYGTTRNNSYDVSDTIVASVWYLQYDEANQEYAFEHVANFDTIQFVDLHYAPYGEYWDFIDVYTLPDASDRLYFAWTQEEDFYDNETLLMYGQVWSVH